MSKDNMQQNRDLYEQVRKYYLQSEYDKAINLLNTIINESPNNPEYLNNLGALYSFSNQVENAKKSFLEAALIDQNYYMAKINLKYIDINMHLKKIYKKEEHPIHIDKLIQNNDLISIIIPTYNNWPITANCLKALQDTCEGIPHEIIIVDNSIEDKTEKGIAHVRSNNLVYVRNKENVGFSKTCNQGAKMAHGNILIFLNNDTISLKGWLYELLRIIQHNDDVAVVGSKLIYPDYTIQHAGVVFSNYSKMSLHIYKHFPNTHPAVNKIREFQAVTAACLMTRRSVFFDVGMFDERFFNGYEDVDFCLKVREKGHRIIYNPYSTLIHLEGKSKGRYDNEDENVKLFKNLWMNKIVPDEASYIMEDNLNILHSLYQKDYNNKIEEYKLFKNLYKLIDRYPSFVPRLLITDVNKFRNKKSYKYFYEMAKSKNIFANDLQTKLIFLKTAVKCAPFQLKCYPIIFNYTFWNLLKNVRTQLS